MYGRWDEFCQWAAQQRGTPEPYSPEKLGPPAPRPEQVFGIGANYRSHAAEGGLEVPEWPMVFTKYVSSFAAPTGVVTLPADTVDWEVELVVVVARTAFHVPPNGAGTTSLGSPSARTSPNAPPNCSDNC